MINEPHEKKSVTKSPPWKQSDERQRTWKTNNYNETYTLEAQKMREKRRRPKYLGIKKPDD